MPQLTAGDRIVDVSQRRILLQAVRLFRMNPAQRQARIGTARARLGAWAKAPATRGDAGAMTREAAVLLSQGVTDV